MSDPTYEVYSGTMRFDDDNIVDVNLEPDTENINVRLNGTEVTIGAELPAVTAADNGDVLTVVEGAWAKAEPTAELPAVTATDNGDVLTVVEGSWAKAEPASQLPAVTASDNGDVLTVVNGAWAKAAPAAGGGDFYVDFSADPQDPTGTVSNKTIAQIAEAVTAGLRVVGRYRGYIDNVLDTVNYIPLTSMFLTEGSECAIFTGTGPLLESQVPVWEYVVSSDGVTYTENLVNIATQ